MKSSVFKSVSLIALAAALGGTSMATSASAKSVKTKGFRVTKITKNTHYQKSAYTKKAPKTGVTIYSSRYLSKHTTSKKTKTFYSTQSVRVVKSTGKQATYRYVTNKSKTVKGWIWTGNLKGKQGKTTSVSNKTVIAPTTNTKIANKTILTPLGKTTSSKAVKTDTAKVYEISDAVSNTNYKGMKNVGKLRDTLNKLASIIKNHPDAWDAHGKKHNQDHKQVYIEVTGVYEYYLTTYTNVIKDSNHGNQDLVNANITELQAYINEAKY